MNIDKVLFPIGVEALQLLKVLYCSCPLLQLLHHY